MECFFVRTWRSLHPPCKSTWNARKGFPRMFPRTKGAAGFSGVSQAWETPIRVMSGGRGRENRKGGAGGRLLGQGPAAAGHGQVGSGKRGMRFTSISILSNPNLSRKPSDPRRSNKQLVFENKYG